MRGEAAVDAPESSDAGEAPEPSDAGEAAVDAPESSDAGEAPEPSDAREPPADSGLAASSATA